MTYTAITHFGKALLSHICKFSILSNIFTKNHIIHFVRLLIIYFTITDRNFEESTKRIYALSVEFKLHSTYKLLKKTDKPTDSAVGLSIKR